jgi:eight-cysteine-cluster-containing protein
VSLHRLFVLALASTSLTVAACATDDTTTDDLAGTTAQDGADVDGKADASGVYTYFTIERDMRKCASPMCGGHFVSRVNLSDTHCADGSWQSSCYVADLDMSGLGLADADLAKVMDYADQGNSRVLLKGTVNKKKINGKTFGVFKATEAWINGTASTPDGVFVKVHDAGIRCIAAPCESTQELKLNSSRTAMIAGLDFAPSGAGDREIEELSYKLFSDGYIVAGDRYTVKENGRTAKGRTVTQYWTRVLPPCFTGGCSGQICSDKQGVISTCEYKPEYACFKTASCERQVDGACGWTQTDELQACLANPPTN